jgi:acylphosphatase
MSGKNFKRLHLFITGQVQGVFFRAYSQAKAHQLGLSGWVRNLPDGRVEMVIEGEPAILEKMLNWCYQGPPRAKVEKIEMVWEKSQGEKEFKIRY